MNTKHLTKKHVPAQATAVDLGTLFLVGNFFFQSVSFVLGWVTTFFNFFINLGIFFAGAVI